MDPKRKPDYKVSLSLAMRAIACHPQAEAMIASRCVNYVGPILQHLAKHQDPRLLAGYPPVILSLAEPRVSPEGLRHRFRLLYDLVKTNTKRYGPPPPPDSELWTDILAQTKANRRLRHPSSQLTASVKHGFGQDVAPRTFPVSVAAGI